MRNRGPLLILALAVAATAAAPWVSAQEKGYPRIEVRTLVKKQENHERLLLVSVTSHLECEDSRIPGSLCVPCEGDKSGAFLPANRDTQIVFYGGLRPLTPGCFPVDEALRRGYPSVYVLRGGLPAWRRAGQDTESAARLPRAPGPAVLPRNLDAWEKAHPGALILDIRPAASFAAGRLDGAVSLPMNDLASQYPKLPLNRAILIVDDDGSQAFTAQSFLARKGLTRLWRLVGGMSALTDERNRRRP